MHAETAECGGNVVGPYLSYWILPFEYLIWRLFFDLCPNNEPSNLINLSAKPVVFSVISWLINSPRLIDK